MEFRIFSINTYAVGSALEEPRCNKDNKSELLEPVPAGMGVILHEYLHGKLKATGTADFTFR